MSLFACIELENAISSDIPGDFGNVNGFSKSSKKTHNRMFAHWLLDTFGQAYLRKGVVDIAGGKGMLSYALGLRYGINCTLIEPREFEMSTITRKRMKSIVKHRESSRNGNRIYDGFDDDILTKVGIEPYPDDGITLDYVVDAAYWGHLPFKHIRSFFYYPLPPLESTLGSANRSSNSVADTVADTVADSSTAGMMTNDKDVLPSNCDANTDNDGKDLDVNEQILKCLHEAACIVGMHSDQATESILDAALALKKPFAILPCCVFSNEFPNRILNGRLVKSYDDFLKYLSLKDSRIRIDYLPFVGRNKVLYMKEEHYR